MPRYDGLANEAGRPTKKTPERIAAIISHVRAGATMTDAAQACGIDRTTLLAWRTDDATFSLAIIEAEAACASEMAACVKKAATTDWRAAESWLKRRRREDWSDRTEVVGAADAPPVQVQVLWEDRIPSVAPGKPDTEE